MASTGIPRQVEQFVRSAIASVQQLEVLLLLRDEHEHAWTAADISRHLKTNPDATDRWLAELESVGLVTAAGAVPAKYRYAPPRETAPVVDELARVYPLYRTRVVALVHARGGADENLL